MLSRKPGNVPTEEEFLFFFFFSDSSHQKKSLRDVSGPSTQYLELPVHRVPDHRDWQSPISQTLPQKKLSAYLGGSQLPACNYHSLQSWPRPPLLLFFSFGDFFSSFPFASMPGKASDVGTTAVSRWGKAVEGISRIIKPGSHRP